MSISIRNDSVEAAWRNALQIIRSDGNDVASVNDPLSIGSSFGGRNRDFREIVGPCLVIENPRDRLIGSSARPLSLAYLLGNVLWTAIGSDDVAQIAFYNSRGWDFSDDQKTVAAAPGKRIFRSTYGDQFAATAGLLRSDPSSRRAVISIYDSSDSGAPHRDCSCLLAIQFLLRDGKLQCIVGMRSQSLACVFPYDAFLLTMIHEAMAVEISTDLGSLIIQYGSLHYYHDESALVDSILSEGKTTSKPMPPMKVSLSHALPYLTQVDSSLQTGDNIADIDPPDEYWRDYAEALSLSVKSTLPLASDSFANKWYSLFF